MKAAATHGDSMRRGEGSMQAHATRIMLILLCFNACVVTALLILAKTYPPMISAGMLAFSFGLRHAVDADHIAAIDNVTRRLIQDGKQPMLVGLWFSLGHSSVVCLICIATASGAAYLQNTGLFEGVGALLSTIVSAGVLLLIGTVNMFALLRETHSSHSNGNNESTHASHGSFCPHLLSAVDSEWKMLPLGFVFGLGFETSSEIALLALAAMSPSQGIPPICTLVLPLLFAGGMCARLRTFRTENAFLAHLQIPVLRRVRAHAHTCTCQCTHLKHAHVHACARG